jgi:hypothetical protein
MNFGFQKGPDGVDEIGRDMILAEKLAALDPASEDPNYWYRFRAGVMSDAARSLAQRRLIAELTVADVVASWGRAIVPTAALAAALAGVMLMRAASVDVDTNVVAPVAEAEVVPVTLAPPAAATFVALRPDTF